MLWCFGAADRDVAASIAAPAKLAAKGLNIQITPDRHMVRRLVAFAHMLVDLAGGEAVGGLGRQHYMIDADAVVAPPGSRLIVPEGILPRRAAAGAEGVG